MSERSHDLVIDALATYRLTRLITRDTFPPIMHTRHRFMQRYPQGAWQAELADCSWCLSFWVGLGVIAVRRLPGWRPLATALAASAVAGLLSEKG